MKEREGQRTANCRDFHLYSILPNMAVRAVPNPSAASSSQPLGANSAFHDKVGVSDILPSIS